MRVTFLHIKGGYLFLFHKTYKLYIFNNFLEVMLGQVFTTLIVIIIIINLNNFDSLNIFPQTNSIFKYEIKVVAVI